MRSSEIFVADGVHVNVMVRDPSEGTGSGTRWVSISSKLQAMGWGGEGGGGSG